MTEEKQELDQPVEESVVQARGLSMGLTLQQAREQMSLSQEDVASRMRLSLRQVKALETEDFSALPDPMITRGFIRNYARLLEIEAEPLLQIYRTLNPSDSPHAISIQSANILISGKSRSHWQIYIVASAVIAMLLAAWLVYFEYFYQPGEAVEQATPEVSVTPPEETTTSESMPEAALPAAERMPEVPVADTHSTVVDLPKANVEPVATPQASTTPEPAKAVSGPKAKVELSFTEQTWVSVLDKNNVEIFNKNKPAGSTDELEGQPPLRMVIGNAVGAKVVYNGKPVNLEPYTKLNITRITLE